ncbi:hypothetical protein STEG23_010648, partial [Scotinomys teguina]
KETELNFVEIIVMAYASLEKRTQGIVCPFEYMDALFILQFPIHLRKQMLLKPASSESSFQPAPGSVIVAQGQLGLSKLRPPPPPPVILIAEQRIRFQACTELRR